MAIDIDIKINDRVKLTSGEIGILKFQGHNPSIMWFEDETGGGCFVSTSDVAEVL